MLGQCHDNQETKTCFDIVETTSTSRQKLSSYGLEHEKKIFSLVDPLKISLDRRSLFSEKFERAIVLISTFHKILPLFQ